MENFDPTEPLKLKFGENSFTKQVTKDEILTLWIPLERVIEVLKYLKTEIAHPFPFLFDLTAIDERSRKKIPIIHRRILRWCIISFHLTAIRSFDLK